MKDLRLSSDRVRPLLEAMTPEKRATAGPVMELITGWMVVTDPPVHTGCASWPPTPSSPLGAEGVGGQLAQPGVDGRVGDDHPAVIISITGPAVARFSGVMASSSGRTRSEESRRSFIPAVTSS